MPSSLSHLFMLTADLAAARRFWVDMLGLEALMEGDGYLRVGGGDGFHIGIEQGDPGPTGSVQITVKVDDVDGTYRRLISAGVEFEAPPADQPWGARHAWLADPDGRRISIYR
jgi:catechol 2,3-dioxygenase-like lactoylglutathione lyase family enzyme